MKKTFFVSITILLLGLFLFSGCYYKALSSKKYYECSDGTQVLEKSQCDALDQLNDLKNQIEDIEYTMPNSEMIDETNEKETVSDNTNTASDSTNEIDEVFSKFAKVKTMRFAYAYNLELPKNTYFASEEQMKIVLESRFGVVNEKYDVVYLDLIAQKATGYCENKDRDVCPDRDKKISVDYDEYIIETPFDWINNINSASITGKSKSLENRKVLEVKFERDGKEGVMFVDSFFAIPMQITFNGKTYEFKDLVVNEATDKDLEHQILG